MKGTHMSLSRYLSGAIILVVLVSLCILGCSSNSSAQTKQRIGIFDSRSVAIVYANSKFFKSPYPEIKKRMEAAKEKNDTKEIAKIEYEAKLHQAILHDQGFGKGSVNTITDLYKDKIAAIAKAENLSAVVSKWEVVYSNPDIELIDITDKIAAFFEPSDKMKETIKEVPQHEPVKDAFFIDD
jgi:Skp family chaperone for outer membrane proteins